MDRADFIRLVGAGAGALALATCIGGCKKEEDDGPAPLNVDFTLDLTQAANSALNNNGGFLRTQGVIVARTLAGSYLAVASACTHQGTAVDYNANTNQFHCPNHGSNFTGSGAVVNGPATRPLQQMNTSLDGNNLRVWS